jgi:hypothetical protein
MRTLKTGLLIIVVAVLGLLLVLRETGLDPRYIDPGSQAFIESGRTAWPGLWLSGDTVREPVSNWDWINQVNDPLRGNTIMLETRTWYGIPHSVTINATPRADRLYIGGSEQDFRLEKEFPHSKRWWANIERDPRVRMKIDGKIYEMTVVLLADRAEVARLIGRDPVTREIDSQGNESITGIRHYWQVFQRNIPEYGDGSVRRAD